MDVITCSWFDCSECAALRAFDEKWKRGEIKAITPIHCEYDHTLSLAENYKLDIEQAAEFMIGVSEVLEDHETAHSLRVALKLREERKAKRQDLDAVDAELLGSG
jgi:hypothetical protein